jgi:hypothetical protein
VNYEKEHGKMETVAGAYNPLNNDRLIPLNEPCDSIFGPIDVDWMLRSSGFGMSGVPGVGGFSAWLDYRVEKFYWNIIRSFGGREIEFDSIFDPTNEMAPHAANRWLSDDALTLERVFKPALDECANDKCKK